MKIFLVTDETHLSLFMQELFKGTAEIQVFPVSSLLDAIHNASPDAKLIIGVLLPSEDDWEKFRQIRSCTCSCYLMLGRAVTFEDVKRANQIGFKEILIDPFLSLKPLLQKSGFLPFQNQSFTDRNSDSQLIYLGRNTYFHSTELWVGCNKTKRPLSEREADLLKLFLRYEGKVLTKGIIAKELWNDQVDQGGISKLVKRLREKLGVKELIEGRKQGGYIFKAEN
ncbi:winged helix-turn-helix domain-containing protein [Effusibacillus consociatus]|uniref:Winged helix-turn-helix domain-containing protein n=1 Tax=Effusibacillus consociatus TaxID=1117041 RepID=A0ABV9Q7H5_9BACL